MTGEQASREMAELDADVEAVLAAVEPGMPTDQSAVTLPEVVRNGI
ncbi:hypothetical protein ACFYO7_10785 [Nocardia salmonicida]